MHKLALDRECSRSAPLTFRFCLEGDAGGGGGMLGLLSKGRECSREHMSKTVMSQYGGGGGGGMWAMLCHVSDRNKNYMNPCLPKRDMFGQA